MGSLQGLGSRCWWFWFGGKGAVGLRGSAYSLWGLCRVHVDWVERWHSNARRVPALHIEKAED